MIAMTYFDFVVGIGVGSKQVIDLGESVLLILLAAVVVACISFVVVSSQRQPIRATLSGASAR